MPSHFKVAVDPALAAVEPAMGQLLQLIVDAVDDKKGLEPAVIDLQGVVDYLDYIVVCAGQTEIQNRAIADNIIQALGRYGIMPDSVSGYGGGQWILLDYGVLVVHVFLPKLREYYGLEQLWAEGHNVSMVRGEG